MQTKLEYLQDIILNKVDLHKDDKSKFKLKITQTENEEYTVITVKKKHFFEKEDYICMCYIGCYIHKLLDKYKIKWYNGYSGFFKPTMDPHITVITEKVDLDSLAFLFKSAN